MRISLAYVALVNDLIEAVPLSMTSWGRTEARNKLVGGAPKSGHLTWQATDFVADSLSDLWAAAQKAVALGFRGVEVDLSNNHLHVDMVDRTWHVLVDRDKNSHPLSFPPPVDRTA